MAGSPFLGLAKRRVIRVLFAVLMCGSLVSFPVNAQESAPLLQSAVVPSAPALFQKVVLLGASITAGFTIAQPFGGPKTPEYRLANYAEAALVGAHDPVITHASPFLFLNPPDTMKRQVMATAAAKPSLVIAMDALFWFCYGTGMTAEQRLERFNLGLQLLEQIDAPLVVGDIPDASKAVGGILSQKEMPELSTIAQCNELLKTWAAKRRNVTVFPISRLMSAAIADEEFSLAGTTWQKGKTRALLQSDRLHASRHGLAALAIGALDAAAAAVPNLPATSICRDVDAVYTAAIARTEIGAANRADAPASKSATDH